MSGEAAGNLVPGGLLHGDTIAATRRALARRFADAGIEQPDLDARILLGHAAGLDLTGLAREADRPLTLAESTMLASLASRRLAREPVALIIGVKEFWGLRLRVTPMTLVPRPETETLVEAALARAAPRDVPPIALPRQLRIADLGTGSGAILLALLHELPQAAGVGVDISGDALLVAGENARTLGLADRAMFVRGDFAAALAPAFDLVLSNPPYLRDDELGLVAPEVRDHEPHLALRGGPDGLAAYRAIAADARRVLKPGGHLLLEIGQGQAEAVTRIVLAGGLVPAGPPLPDLAGITRVLAFARP